MPTFITQYIELWRRLKAGQRVAIIGAAAATIALIAALVFYGSQPEYRVLFSDLKPADAQAIVEKLKAANVQYQLSNNGTVVSVPSERVAELRLQMASSGVLSGGHVGFDIFDKTNFGATDFTQQVNYQRALEGELARTLEGMDEVESARVHITQPRESVFADKAERAKASVVVRVRQGRELSRERTEAIINLIASAVQGLDPSDLSVMDTRGRLLSSPGRQGSAGDSIAFNSHLETRRKFEAETAARIVSLIEPISGVGHVRADVAAELDFSQIEQTEEKFDPKSAVIRSQQSTQEVKGMSASASSVVGARANDPTTQTVPATPTQNPAGDQRAATTTNYEIDKTVKHTVVGSGRITRLSASVVVDYKVASGVATARTPEELKKMQELIAAAVGIDPSRGDQIIVQTIPFDQPTVEVHNPTWMERHNEVVRMGIKYGALVFAALLLIIFVIRPTRRALRRADGNPQLQLLPADAGAATIALTPNQMQMGDIASANVGSLEAPKQPGMPAPRTVAEIEAEMEAEVAREMASFVPELKRASAIKKQLLETVKQEPNTIAMTLRGWLQES